MDLSYRGQTANESDLTTYTFSSQSFGAAAASRRFIVSVSSSGNEVAGTITISSITIGGVSASISVENGASDVGATGIAALAIAAVPTGTTGDVVVTFSTSMLRCGIALWRVADISSITLTDTGISSADPQTATIDLASNAIVIGIGNNKSGGSSVTWTNLTERFEAELGISAVQYSGASDEIIGQSSRTITATWTAVDSSIRSRAFAVASWEFEEVFGPANLKTWNGVAKANIKTINGVPIANTKTYNGVA